ncbi:MAG: bifunctional nuclease family protein [Acidobacteriota bacterium]|nr:bifunctional nuclease family protein [Blastocatellia bacterium]MDW8240398.1 bifunctional nuclease family protein [Acidobacteriota bacterium]
MELEVKVRGLILDPTSNSPIVILKDLTSDAMLPIWIGVCEANAIAMEMEKSVAQRPMTHDLLKNLIDQVEARVEKVVINDLVENTFYAVIVLSFNGKTLIVDSRPSDAVAIALRTDSPIFVSESVMRNSKNTFSSLDFEEVEDRSAGEDDWSDIDDDPGKYKM